MADEEEKEEKAAATDAAEEKKEEAAPVVAEETKTEEKPAEEKPAPKKEKQAPTGKHADLIKEIEKMPVADLAELVKALEDRFGVSAAPAMVAAPSAGGAPGAAPAEGGATGGGKPSYTVHLAASGEQKIAVIKALREVKPDLGLKEAKDLVDGAPKDVAQNVPAEDAQKAKEKLEAVGAKVELK